MNVVEIEEAVSQLAEAPFDSEKFPFAFLEAFGNKPTTIKRLRSGNSNQSDRGGVLQRNNIHIKVCPEGSVAETLTALRESPATSRNKAKFILATDGQTLEAENLLDWLSICPPTGTGVKVLREDADLFSEPEEAAEVDFENEGGETYICGNPPYLGSTWQSKEQKDDLKHIFDGRTKQWKSLDYVSGWFMKAADYVTHTKSAAAFVSTNSICQGQQVPILWPLIFKTDHEIAFAHTSFKWANLASHNAGVTVIIVRITVLLDDSNAAQQHCDHRIQVQRDKVDLRWGAIALLSPRHSENCSAQTASARCRNISQRPTGSTR
jgi:hypothetical protein